MNYIDLLKLTRFIGHHGQLVQLNHAVRRHRRYTDLLVDVLRLETNS